MTATPETRHSLLVRVRRGDKRAWTEFAEIYQPLIYRLNDRLERFLEDRLPADEEAALISHLDVCPACRERLDGMSASDDDWSEFRGCLAGESIPRPATVLIGAAAWIHRGPAEPAMATTPGPPLGTADDRSATAIEEVLVPVAEYTPADERAWQETMRQATQAADRLEAGWLLPIEEPSADPLTPMAAELEADLTEIERRHAAVP